MDEARLRHFFTMHGENLERKAGRSGRGKWGTGKSAAFGIAGMIRVDTVRCGLRNVVELWRTAIEESTGEAIPVKWLVRNEEVEAVNGTTITIGQIFLGRVEKGPIIEYIERNLPAFRTSNPTVAVGSHICEYHSPPVAKTVAFGPNDRQAAILGEVMLTIHAATKPLSDWEQGIAVTAGAGNLVAIERGGVEHKEFGNYLFGEVDVPALETYETPLEPFDPSRSLTLNPKHPVVAALLGFVGSKLELVRSQLVASEREARKQEEARRLAKQANDLEDILNNDFVGQMQRLRDVRAATSRGAATAGTQGSGGSGGEEPDLWIEGLDVPRDLDSDHGDGKCGMGQDRPAPVIPKMGHPSDQGENVVSPVGGEGPRKRPRGGFRVDFRSLGEDEDRSVYDSNNMAIIINKDHPVVAAALKCDGIESVSFRRLSYEIAFSEYAIALSYEMENRDPAMPADDVLYDIRATLRRITRAAAPLYA